MGRDDFNTRSRLDLCVLNGGVRGRSMGGTTLIRGHDLTFVYLMGA